MALKNTRSDNTFVTILSDGTLRVTVPEGTDGAVKREYETSDGKKGVKYEHVFTELFGMIKKINFFEGSYGKSLQIIVEDNGEEYNLSVNTESNFGEDLMKKLPSVDMKKPVLIVPYSFDDEKGKKKRGVTISQDGKKIQNFFLDKETNKSKSGYPEVPKKKMTKDDWKLYFMNARIFLIEYISNNIVGEKTSEQTAEEKFDDLG